MKSELVAIFSRIQDQKVMKKFFQEIFTDAERSDLELRWELMKRLHDGIPQREIASKLGISLCKITRGSKIVKSKTSTTNKILNGKI
ncbi:MAG: Trp family transcriptional regulator [Kiritimatiellae bacterium]|nr:Trp family transcriptional regulator [Kiritimatiellia bacterium]